MTTNAARNINLRSFGNVNVQGCSVSISIHSVSVFRYIDFI